MKGKSYYIGIDGFDFKYIEKFINEGLLPNLKKIINNGSSAVLNSTKPPLTPVAWTSLFSGMKPESHQLFDWTHFKDNDYTELIPYLSTDVKVPRLWDYLTNNSFPSIVMNFPMTYPPSEINGIFISGFGKPENRDDFFYPLNIKNEIENKFGDYKIEVPYVEFTKNPDKYIRMSGDLSYKLTEIFIYLVKKYDSPVNMLCYMLADHINHYYKGNKEAHVEAIKKAYIIIDECLGKIISQMTEDDNLFIFSDHGSMIIENNIYLNKYLMEQGYLKFNNSCLPKNFINHLSKVIGEKIFFCSSLAQKFSFKILKKLPGFINYLILKLLRKYTYMGYSYNQIDWNKTTAFVKSFYGQIYVNKKKLSLKAYKDIIKELKLKLEKLKDDNIKIFEKVEIIGNYNDFQKPDLWVYPKNETDHINNFNFKIKSKFREKNTQSYAGEHRQKGVFMAYGKNIKKRTRISEKNIFDVLPTILTQLGFDISQLKLDGKVIDDIFETNPKLIFKLKNINIEKKNSEINNSDSEKIKKQLENLGYL